MAVTGEDKLGAPAIQQHTARAHMGNSSTANTAEVTWLCHCGARSRSQLASSLCSPPAPSGSDALSQLRSPGLQAAFALHAIRGVPSCSLQRQGWLTLGDTMGSRTN